MSENDGSEDIATTRLSTLLTPNTIIVKVGAEAKRYELHKALLEDRAGYFRGALSGQFVETKNGVIDLEDVEVDAFDVFVEWLYSHDGTLPRNLYEQDIRFHDTDEVPLQWRSYVLADRLLAVGMKSVMRCHLAELYRDHPYEIPPELSIIIIYCFSKLPGTDPLLQVLINIWCTNKGFDLMTKESLALVPDLPKEFFVGVVLKSHALDRIPKKAPRRGYGGL